MTSPTFPTKRAIVTRTCYRTSNVASRYKESGTRALAARCSVEGSTSVEFHFPASGSLQGTRRPFRTSPLSSTNRQTDTDTSIHRTHRTLPLLANPLSFSTHKNGLIFFHAAVGSSRPRSNVVDKIRSIPQQQVLTTYATLEQLLHCTFASST